MPEFVVIFAPYLVGFGVLVAVVGILRFTAKPWALAVEPVVLGLALVCLWVLGTDSFSNIWPTRLISVWHGIAASAAAITAAAIPRFHILPSRWASAAVGGVAGWCSFTLLMWFYWGLQGQDIWLLPVFAVLTSAVLIMQFRRLDREQAFTPACILIGLAAAAVAAVALYQDVRDATLLTIVVSLSIGVVGFVRFGPVSWLLAGFLSVALAAPAVKVMAERPDAIPAYLILALVLFAPQAITFKTPPKSGLEGLGRRSLKIILAAIPAILAIAVGFIATAPA